MRLILSTEALDDLEDIYTYSLSMWGPEQADKYRTRVFSTLSLLEDQPMLGRPLVGYPFETRVLRIEQHNVLYRVEGEVVRVLRLAHFRRHILPEFR